MHHFLETHLSPGEQWLVFVSHGASCYNEHIPEMVLFPLCPALLTAVDMGRECEGKGIQAFEYYLKSEKHWTNV